MRNSPRRSVPPASAVFIRCAASQTVSPSGTRSSVPCRVAAAGVSRLTTGMTGGRRAALEPRVSVPLRLRARFGADAPTPPAEPVTVTVARVVRPDRREAFERWAEDVLQVAAGFPGNLGASLLHPGPDSSEYHLVYRFVDDDVARRLGAVVGAAVGAGARRGRWSTTSATPGCPGWRASSPASPQPGPALADDAC